MNKHYAESEIDNMIEKTNILNGIRVFDDSPEFDTIGFDNSVSTANGEFVLMPKIIKPGDVVFDIGANTGEWSRQVLASVGRVVIQCFEPVPDTFEQLRMNLGNCGVGMHKFAMSNSNGTKTFNYYNQNTKLARLSTFYRRSKEIEQRFSMQPVEIEVQTCTLDTFCQQHSVTRIDYLKIDTEGAELDVLQGSQKILSEKRVKKMQFEYGGNFEDAGITLHEVCRLLTKHGYSIFRILPEGIVHVSQWRQSLENYRYSNYLVIDANLTGNYGPMTGFEDSNTLTQSSDTIGLIFSKDRAMQLQAVLESFLLHCKDPNRTRLKVLYKATNDLSRRLYDKLKSKFANVTFVEETTFRQQVIDITTESPHILFMVDDNIFVRDFRLGDIIDSLTANPDAIGFSLRLGRNTCHNYNRNLTSALPDLQVVTDEIVKYDWTNQEHHFAYPLEVSSSVYRANEILPLLQQLDFPNPNMLEGLMAANAKLYNQARNTLLCFDLSVTFCNPLNLVQTVCTNKTGNYDQYSAENLAAMFAQGYSIDINEYNGLIPFGCHQDVELFFRHEKTDVNVNPPALRVTVEMIVYNAERFIALAIESVLAQTFKDFELLIIDDGSTDSTRQIIESYSDSRIRYIYKEHKNRWAGTNRAITEARGEYIIAIDSDDCIANDYLEKMLATAALHPEIDFFYPAGFVIIDENNKPNGARWQYHDFSDNRILPHYLFDQGHSPIPYPGSLRRMSMYKKTGGYEEIKNVADFVFLCRNALKVNFKRVTDHSNYYYRSLPTSLSKSFEQRDETTSRVLNEMISLYEPRFICPQIAEIKDPGLAKKSYYKYLAQTFDKHARGYHLVRHGEFFQKYGDYYNAELSKLDACGNMNLSRLCRGLFNLSV